MAGAGACWCRGGRRPCGLVSFRTATFTGIATFTASKTISRPSECGVDIDDVDQFMVDEFLDAESQQFATVP